MSGPITMENYKGLDAREQCLALRQFLDDIRAEAAGLEEQVRLLETRYNATEHQFSNVKFWLPETAWRLLENTHPTLCRLRDCVRDARNAATQAMEHLKGVRRMASGKRGAE